MSSRTLAASCASSAPSPTSSRDTPVAARRAASAAFTCSASTDSMEKLSRAGPASLVVSPLGGSPGRCAATMRSSSRLAHRLATSIHSASVSGVITESSSRALVQPNAPKARASSKRGKSGRARPIRTSALVLRALSCSLVLA